jgi:ABC-type sugar transport system permease subunit
MVSTAPLLIGSFAFNFNNFVLIFLLTRGGPPLAGYSVPVGDTDILISFTFNLAIASGRGADYGLAAAITIFIFAIVVILSATSFRYTRRLEEVYGGL